MGELMIRSWSGRLAAAASLVFMVLAPVRAADAPGIQWETTSQMVMEGMPMAMPAQNLKICAAKEWTKPPQGGDPSCKNSNFQRAGNKATWTVECTGEMKMSGAGEMTFNEAGDSYTGTIKFTAEEMNMTVKLAGKKIGSCDNPQ
jgi:hypothetical protein